MLTKSINTWLQQSKASDIVMCKPCIKYAHNASVSEQNAWKCSVVIDADKVDSSTAQTAKLDSKWF